MAILLQLQIIVYDNAYPDYMLVLIFMFLFVSDIQADWQLAESRIDIWRFKINKDPNLIPNCLNEQEMIRANRFHFIEHQHRFRVARTTMRQILGLYLNINAEDIVFQYDKGGKPSVATDIPISFNLSHTGDYACLAIGLNSPIGIDIERYSIRDYYGIAGHVFSEQEQYQLKSVANFLLPMAFFSLWSQKEAVIKCNGLGMRYPLKKLSLPIFSTPGHIFLDVVDRIERQIHRFTPYIGTAAALCCHTKVSIIRCFDWQG